MSDADGKEVRRDEAPVPVGEEGTDENMVGRCFSYG